MTTGLADSKTRTARSNPYVGPRPFRQNEPFYGRERETTALVNTLLSGRVVLLHSPSGAGKTSLIQAAVAPIFASRRFQVCVAAQPRFSALRVNLPPPSDVDVPNRYVFSVVNGLVGHLVERNQALTMSIEDALQVFASHGADTDEQSAARPTYQLVILDQLEEVLTLDPGDLKGQSEFFRQLGESLDQPHRWGLLAMREDYMGGLDRFQRYIPGQLRSTFRLDFLDDSAALRAVKEPARLMGVQFEDPAANLLVASLRHGRPDADGQGAGAPKSPFVEPMLLQVVCDDLWRKLAAKRGQEFTAITEEDVRSVQPFDKALTRYYRGVIAEAARGDRARERAIRDWIEEHLITKDDLRRPTRSRPAVPDAEAVMDVMQKRYLIRDDARPGGSWWELSHDILIAPILTNNRAWRVKNLALWEVNAERWQRSGRDSAYLLRGPDYRRARAQAKKAEPTTLELEFLEASRRVALEDNRRGKLQARVSGLSVALGLSLIFNVVLFLLWMHAR